MATAIVVTPQPIRVTAITKQPLWQAYDVSELDVLDLIAVCTVEGTPGSLNIRLWFGMQMETEAGWFVTSTPDNFPTTFPGSGSQTPKANVDGTFLRYKAMTAQEIRGEVSRRTGQEVAYSTVHTFLKRAVERKELERRGKKYRRPKGE
jgi:hypothetical protein